jgi:chaperone modulatory protein CbpM
MMPKDPPSPALIDDLWLDLDTLARAAIVDSNWLSERAAAGLLTRGGAEPDAWRFDVSTVRRLRCMVRIERDFDAVPELAALVADLEDEIARLRARLGALDDRS